MPDLNHRRSNIHWLWLSLLVILLDQVAKYIVERSIQRFDAVPLLPHLNFVNMHNTGAAFSMFNTAPAAVFIVLGAAVSGAILFWLRKHPYDHRIEASAFTLILGGALGNAIDRSLRGYVVDFVDFFVASWHFAAFNIADSAITIGAGLLILDMVLATRRARVAKLAEEIPPESPAP